MSVLSGSVGRWAKAGLAKDDFVKSFQVGVETNQGVVLVRGTPEMLEHARVVLDPTGPTHLLAFAPSAPSSGGESLGNAGA